MTPPRWLADRIATSNEARTSRCPMCRQPVIRAFVEGRDVRADPAPLDVAAELLVKLAGEWTFDLVRTWPGAAIARLCLRYPHHLTRRRYPVLGIHRCPGPAPPEPQHDDRLF